MKEKVDKCDCSTKEELVVDGRYLFEHVLGSVYLFDAKVVELSKHAIKLGFDTGNESWYLKKDFYKKNRVVEVLYKPEQDKGGCYLASYPLFFTTPYPLRRRGIGQYAGCENWC